VMSIIPIEQESNPLRDIGRALDLHDIPMIEEQG